MTTQEILQRFDGKFTDKGDERYGLAKHNNTVLQHQVDWLSSEIQALLTTAIEEMEKKTKIGQDGEDLPFENSPEIYGNQRQEAFKKGFNQAITTCQDILKGMLK